MALTLGDNFSYQGAKPLDGRLKYDTLANMKAVGDSTMYDGCLAYCVATDKTYQWKSTNTVDSSTGRWREFSSGGGSYTAGDGIEITNDVISTDTLQEGDMDDIVTPLPTPSPSPGGASALDELTDVDIESVTDGDIIKYNSTTQKWENSPESGGGASALADLSDIDLTSLTDGQIIKYNASTQKWENAAESGGGGGCGSIFNVGVILPALYGTTCTITDEDSNTFTGTFDNSGQCTITGVDSIGDLVVSTTNGMSQTIHVDYFSKYGTVFGIQPLSGVSYEEAYGVADFLVNNHMATLAGTVVHLIGSGYNTWNSSSSNIAALTTANMTSFYTSGNILGGTITQEQVGDGGNFKFNSDGYAVISDVLNKGSDPQSMSVMRSYGNIFNLVFITANDTIPMNTTGNETKWVTFYPSV